MVTRRDDWPSVLAQEIANARSRPFQWGAHDCATWAFDVAARLRDTPSHADAWRGLYDTEFGAGRVLLSFGWRSLEEGGRELLGAPKPPLLAQRGDIVLGEAFGVCNGAAWFAPGGRGIERLSLRSARMAWSV